MLEVAGEGAGDGNGESRNNRQEQQQDGEGSPIIQAANLPRGAPAGEDPADGAVTEIEEDKKKGREEGDELGDVMQNVVAHFVAGDVNNLGRVHIGDGGVPDDDALGGAEPGDVGIQGGRFFASAHPEHALGRNVLAGALHHQFESFCERGSFLGEGLKLVEERIDDERLEEEKQKAVRQRNEPKIEPPTAGRPADHAVKDPDEDHANDDGDDFALGPIPKPGSPSLHGEAVGALDPVLIDARGKYEDVNRENQEGRKDQSLDKAPARSSLGQGAILGSQLPAKDEQENHDPIDEIDEKETK